MYCAQPIPTLFPYTTLFRSMRLEGEDNLNAGDKVMCDIFKAQERVHVVATSKGRGFAGFVKRHHFRGGRATHGRSEEHTSELQSLRHLVCRLLLEKKKHTTL